MMASPLLKLLLPLACQWAEQQEKKIIGKGVALDDDQRIDAYLIGVKDIEKVRLLPVKSLPLPSLPAFKDAASMVGLVPANIIGSTFRYGIYIRSDCWNQRKLVAHELSHTMQYERMGGFKPFIEQYLLECLTVGYPHGALEQEARQIAKEICTQH